jgi:peptidoglycan/LPS O-acetylase OafA/YrhL
MTAPSQNRLLFIDSIRGIAALLVLFQHSYEYFFRNQVEEIGHSFFHFGQAGVVAFFLVSGYIIPFSLERSTSLTSFFIHRIFRIYPLYLVILLINLLLVYSGIDQMEDEVNPFRIFSTHLFFVQEYLAGNWSLNLVVGSWTLFIEAIWYVAAAVLFRFRLPHQTILNLAITGFFILITASVFLNIRLPLGRMGMLLHCVMGLHFYRRSQNLISSDSFFAYALVLGFVQLAGLWVAYGYFSSDHFTAGCVMTSWAGAYALFLLFYNGKPTEKTKWDSVLSYLGSISYSLYLCHFTCIILLDFVLGKTVSGFVATLFLTVLISHFSYRLIEKPGIAFGKRITLKPSDV